MASMTSKQSDGGDVPIEELIFSCSLCQATVSDIYATTDSTKGFNSGCSDQVDIVTKLWIGECTHVTCSKHLQGGGKLRPHTGIPLC